MLNKIYYRETIWKNEDVQELTLLSDNWRVTRVEIDDDLWPRLHIWLEARYVGDVELTPVKRTVQIVRGSTLPEDSVAIATFDVPGVRIDNLVMFNKD